MKNGTCWLDTEGNLIQAHGGIIMKYENLYYWYGENKDTDTNIGMGKVDFLGFSCYSSANLKNWKNEGLVLKAVNDDPEHELSPACIGERPKVIYNKKTGKFIMWFHLDKAGYGYARAGVAVSESPTGPFEYLGSVWVNSHQCPNGSDCRDLTLYEEDGVAYLICSSNWNSTTLICKLDDTYTKLSGDIKMAFIEQYREAPVLIKEKDTYYMFSSGCTGWAPNSMLYGTAKAVMGSWKLIDNPCSGPDYRKTFYGQCANAFKANGQWYIMLDHWNSQDLRRSGYSFLPVHISDDYVEIPWTDEF